MMVLNAIIPRQDFRTLNNFINTSLSEYCTVRLKMALSAGPFLYQILKTKTNEFERKIEWLGKILQPIFKVRNPLKMG